MEKKIIFQKCTINYIYFLLYSISYLLLQTLDYLKENPEQHNNNYFSLSLQLVSTYTSNISDFFAIIPYFIQKKLSKNKKVNSKKIENIKKNDKDNEFKNHNKLFYNNTEKSHEKRKKNY